MLGTKCPSITSTCTQSQPAASMARTSSPSRAKSADRIEGAIRTLRVIAIPEVVCLRRENTQVSYRGLSPVSSHHRSLEHAAAWIPGTRPGMTLLSLAARFGRSALGVALQEIDHS